MRFNNLQDWLSWQETLNPAEIDLGLERILAVLSQAGLSPRFNCPLITVAGTNGKGSVVAMLESITLSAGLKVCSYTSPHLLTYNERIKINGQPVSDDLLCEAFAHIDEARGDLALTYFEFGTLAAIELFHRQSADIIIMEVGLGGRLDAVNCMDSDVSILTSVAIDHIDWLGDNRETIGYEKAGVFRADRPVICGDADPPNSVVKHARQLHCRFLRINRDYQAVPSASAEENWALESRYQDIHDLPAPSLLGHFQKDNAATAIVALQALQKEGILDKTDMLSRETMASGLQQIKLAGRFQQIYQAPPVYLDVAHNPHAAAALASQLRSNRVASSNRTWAITAMLADKEVAEVIKIVSSEVDVWCFAGLEDVARGLGVQELLGRLVASEDTPTKLDFDEINHHQIQHELSKNQCTILNADVWLANTVTKACEQVLANIEEGDRLIIFGSFYTAAQALQFFTDLKDDVMGLKH